MRGRVRLRCLEIRAGLWLVCLLQVKEITIYIGSHYYLVLFIQEIIIYIGAYVRAAGYSHLVVLAGFDIIIT